MKQITINPNNESYYSEDFIKGFKCGAQRQFEADKSDAGRPHGHWTKTDVATYRCSECGKKQIADDTNELNYCCCCGSRNKVRRLKGADDAK